MPGLKSRPISEARAKANTGAKAKANTEAKAKANTKAKAKANTGDSGAGSLHPHPSAKNVYGWGTRRKA